MYVREFLWAWCKRQYKEIQFIQLYLFKATSCLLFIEDELGIKANPMKEKRADMMLHSCEPRSKYEL